MEWIRFHSITSGIFIGILLKAYLGNELLWTDTKGALDVHNHYDAEGDKQEMMLEKYETLLPEFIEKIGHVRF